MTDRDNRSIPAVGRTFDTIAEDFDRTRTAPWPAVEGFVSDDRTGRLALDIGCGNGRHSSVLLEQFTEVVGLDLSRQLLRLANDRIASDRLTLIQASSTAIPVRAESVDAALYIAAIHHLPNRQSRVRSLDELARVLNQGASALVSGWSIYDDRFDFDTATDTTVDWTLPSGDTVPRFYHLYDADDFAGELAASDLTVDRRWVEAGNCYAIVRPRGE